MAESLLLSLSCKILSCAASPAFKKAYEKGVSIWEARDELSKLQLTIETLQAVLIDAEKKQEGSAAVNNWVQRLKNVLYDAEDLFDEFATEDLIKQQMKEGKSKLSLKKQVQICCSKLNPIVSRNSIANRVKAIRGKLVDISTDMAHFGFVHYHPNEAMHNIRRDRYTASCSRGAKAVFGRDEDKKAILDMLISESSDTCEPVVIAIDGIGGVGKTTLAHMIYRDENVQIFFEKRWFACISDTFCEAEVLGKIYQSICGGSYNDLSVTQLEEQIRVSIEGNKYLLVLDDVWEDHHGRWENRKSLLSCGANGSRILVTTRMPSVLVAMGAVEAHNLRVLSEKDSWNLFKSLAFGPGHEKDSRRESLGKELLKRCRGLPLSIWCMGSLLHNKTIQEWEDLERDGLPTLRGKHDDETMSILKLSYDHLPSNLKLCFTYCSLFPKDYRYAKTDLIYHWTAQGYIKSGEEESEFMHLLRMGFFQEAEDNGPCNIFGVKMHDIMHDLALYLAGEESITLSPTSLNVSSNARNVRLSELSEIPSSLLNAKSLRSFQMRESPYQQSNLEQLFSKFKLLRTLALSGLGIQHIPPSIGELKLLRYLDLSRNRFEELPDSITNLVNLITLDLHQCTILEALPRDFKRLMKLRNLELSLTSDLRLMPEGIGGMVCLQYLSDYKVGKESDLDELTGLLKQLRGDMAISFSKEMKVGSEWKLPANISLQELYIEDYPGQKIVGCGYNEGPNKLEHLRLGSCTSVEYLPPFSCFSILKFLQLFDLPELEFVEEEAAYNKLFFPCLEELQLSILIKLKGWRRKISAESSTSTSSSFVEFSRLSKLHINDCPELDLKSFPPCPNLSCLQLYPLPPIEELQLQLPQCLLQRHSLDQLQVKEAWG